MSKPTKSVGDVWLLCHEPQALALVMQREFKVSTASFRVSAGREYIHIYAKMLPKKLLENINDPQFRAKHGIVQIHFEQPVGIPRPVTGV